MEDLTTKTNGMGDLIKTGQNNQKGLIGAIALAVASVGMAAIKAISSK